MKTPSLFASLPSVQSSSSLAACRLPPAASIPELRARYFRTHSIDDLLAWSDAVGAETGRLLTELANLRRRG